MGNCLVTKLKGAVNNPDLIKLGHYRAIFDHQTGYGALTNTTPVTVSVASGSARIFQYGDVEVSFPITITDGSFYNIIPGDGGCVLDFDNKYTADSAGFLVGRAKRGSFPLEELKYFTNLKIIDGGARASEGALVFDTFDEYQKGLVLDQILYASLRTELITGDIKYIPYIFPNIVNGDDPQQTYGICLYISSITGALEDLVRSYRSIGKTINSLKLNGWVRKANITFNGHNLANESYDGSTLSWTDTTMTLNDETINA